MKKSIENLGSVIALSLILGIGASACGGENVTFGSTSSEPAPNIEVAMANQIDSHLTKADKVKQIPNGNYGITIDATLPDQTQVLLELSSQGEIPSGFDSSKGPSEVPDPSKVDGITALVLPLTSAQPNAKLENGVKQAYSVSLGKDIAGGWDANYYQFMDPNAPYFMGEVSSTNQVETISSPGIESPTMYYDVHESTHISKEVMDMTRTILSAVISHTSITSIPSASLSK